MSWFDDESSSEALSNFTQTQLLDIIERIDSHVKALNESIETMAKTKDDLQALREEYFQVVYDNYYNQ